MKSYKFTTFLLFYGGHSNIFLIIDRIAGEIIRFVASVCVCVRLFVCGHSSV